MRTRLRAGLGWLTGFPLQAHPDGVRWLAVPTLTSRSEVQSLTVDGARLRSSTFAAQALRARFPRALPRVVGDVEAWSAALSARLERLKACVHAGAALPDAEELLTLAGARPALVARVAALVRRAPELGPLLLAWTWRRFGDLARLTADLERAEAHVGALRELLARGPALAACPALQGLAPDVAGLLVATRWCAWSAAGAPPALLELVADPRAWTVPTRGEGLTNALQAALTRRARGWEDAARRLEQGFPRAQPTLGPELLEFLLGLPARAPQERERGWRVAALLHGGEQLDAWEAWWARYDVAERRVRRALGRRAHGLPEEERERPDAAQVVAELPPPPAAVAWIGGPHDPHGGGFHVLRAVARTAPVVFEALCGLCAALPDDPAGRELRRVALRAWSHVLDAPARTVARLLTAQTELLRQTRRDEVRRWIVERLSAELHDPWLSERTPLRELTPALATLRAVLERHAGAWDRFRGPFATHAGWWGVLACSRASASADEAAELVLAFDGLGATSDATWRAWLALSGAAPARARGLAQAWKDPGPPGLVQELELTCADPARAAFLGDALIDGEGARVWRLLALVRALRALDGPALEAWGERPLVGDAPPPAHLPADLAPAFAELARWVPDPTDALGRVLARELPDPARLRRELEALRARAEVAPGLAARARALEARLDAPPALSPAKLARCAGKLLRRARLARLEALEARLREATAATLERACGASDASWVADPRLLDLVAAVAALPPASRALGLRLVGVRAGPPPWDLREAPANRAFVERLRARGYDPAPWVEGIGPRRLTGEPAWTLDLERDPLEVLRMGEPFRTCLAPGSFNFFSAVSNAADLNKRVLYARDPEGAIRGRCLLALTADPALLIFRVYGQDRREQLEAGVRAYARELAAAVGVPIAPRTTVVERLVASDWYDDGAQDLTAGGDPALTAVLDGWDALAPDEVRPALEGACGGAPAPGLVASLLASGRFVRRPALFPPLLDLLPERGLDPWTRLAAVEALLAAGARDPARTLLEPLARPPRLGADAWCASQGYARIADAFVTLGEPHRGLQLLRRTRPADVSGLDDDYAHRLGAAARATRALQRPRKALRLFRAAQAAGDGRAADAIRELEDELGEP